MQPTLRYPIDAFHPKWNCGLEVEVGRGWMGNAIYRDLVQAPVMVGVDVLVLALANQHKYQSGGRFTVIHDYDNAGSVCEALYGHSRIELPYKLMLIG